MAFVLGACRDEFVPNAASIEVRGPLAVLLEGSWSSLSACEPRPAGTVHCASARLDDSRTRAIDVAADTSLVSQLVTFRVAPGESLRLAESRLTRLTRVLGTARTCGDRHWWWPRTGGMAAALVMMDEPAQSGRPRVVIAEWVGVDSLPALFRCRAP